MLRQPLFYAQKSVYTEGSLFDTIEKGPLSINDIFDLNHGLILPCGLLFRDFDTRWSTDNFEFSTTVLQMLIITAFHVI
jgi:hypothetical protein